MDRGRLGCVVILPNAGTGHGQVGRVEFRAVEGVERLEAELQFDALGDGGVLDHRQVDVVRAILPQVAVARPEGS